MSIHRSTKSYYGRTLLITLSFLSMLFVASISHAYANTVNINDQAGVLDSNKVRSDAAHLPVSVLIYTTKTFTGDQTALNDDARNHLSGTNTVDIAIDTAQRHLSIQSGSQVKLSDGQASNAVDAFKNSFHNGDYTGATIAAIDSVHDALTNGSSSGGMTPVGVVVGVLLAIIFLVCLVFFIVSVVRNRRRGGPPMGGGRRGGNQQWNNGNNVYHPYPVYTPPPTTNTGGGFGGGGSFGGGAGGSF
jgi:hypothetical protein